MGSNASISVNKETVRGYLESGKANPFLIPEYQRPYAWGEDEVTQLFDDLREFTESEIEKEKAGGQYKEGTFFLGTIVAYLNEDTGEREVIDGQQRITSLLLLLRAIYTKLQKTEPKTPEAENFMAQIEPCIWRKDKLSGKVDYTRILITSKATDDEFNERLNLILMEGEADEGWHDNYSVNYRIFQQLYDDLNAKNALLVYNFVHSVLNCAIVLPIQADTQDTALTIFNTLNDRGLPLSDADIFKAKIYETKQGADRDAFVKAWKEIESKALDVDESMQHLFYIYMFYRRALDGDVKTTTPGARKRGLGNRKSSIIALQQQPATYSANEGVFREPV